MMSQTILLRAAKACAVFALCAAVVLPAAAQSRRQVTVKQAKVVYVSGNDVVLKNTAGEVKHVTVPADFKFTVDGQQLSVADLKPGMVLTQTITTTTTERTVQTVRHATGKVWQVNAPWLTVTLPDGTNKRLKVPDGTKFEVDGQQKTVFDLRPGMNLSATVMTTTPETLVSSTSRVTGTAPPEVQTPELVGVLLVEEIPAPAPAAPAPTRTMAQAPAAAPAPAEELPKTGTALPLVGLLGMLALASGVALRFAARTR